jgi:glycosyltransferase XagB
VFAPLLPAYWLMHWTASWRGLYQLIRAPFLWEKTPHPAAAA